MAVVEKITRHIKLASRDREIIDYTAGTNLLPVCFIIDDWTIPDGAAASIYVQKPSGAIVYNTGTVNKNLNSVEFTPTAQMFIEGGTTPAQIQFLVGGKILNSYLITFEVENQVVSDEAIESTDEFMAFESILSNAQTLTESAVADYVSSHGIQTGANATQAAQIEANKTMATQANADIQALTETVTSLASTVSDLAASVASMVEAVNEVLATVQSDHEQLENLQDEMDDLNEGIEAYDLADIL